MSVKRKSTVHDYSSLRLHPDGTRDRRGNWIARDAGGLGRVKQRWSNHAASDDHTPQTEEDEAGSSQPRTPAKDKGKGRATESPGYEETNCDKNELKDVRAVRRKLFVEDLDFLRPSSLQVTSADVEDPSSSDSHLYPTSVSFSYHELAFIRAILIAYDQDLLKCIHHFASTYYNEMGQLRDSTREYRTERKRKRVERLKSEGDSMNGSLSRQMSADPSEGQSQDQVDVNEGDLDGETEDKLEGSNAKRRRIRARQRRNDHTSIDMYKMLDGSALMAIGLLLQEFVMAEVSQRVPEGWEEEMIRAQELEERGRHKRKKNRKRRRRRRQVGELSEEEAALTTELEEEGGTDAQMSIALDDNEIHGEPFAES
ncbi:hypothetical protein NM688_g3491 [Phlebia brevispora]|uniref:Uncharacterized protein n=1 Tax=Phlebia brevispora TaxID=194682 RepID=A0ACC1T5P3_9APHY|nr:hypothetical protein NM688_g3491 [Phlebia brevispora]